MSKSYATDHNCVSTRSLAAQDTIRFFVKVGEELGEETLVAEIVNNPTNPVPIPKKGEQVIFDLNMPVNDDPAYDDYVSQGIVYKVKRVCHCYGDKEINDHIDVMMEIDDAD